MILKRQQIVTMVKDIQSDPKLTAGQLLAKYSVTAQDLSPLTQVFVDRGFVQSGSFNAVATWLRSITLKELQLYSPGIYEDYLENAKPVVLDDQISARGDYITTQDTKIALVNQMIRESGADQDRIDVLTILLGYLQATKDRATREKDRLQEERDRIE